MLPTTFDLPYIFYMSLQTLYRLQLFLFLFKFSIVNIWYLPDSSANKVFETSNGLVGYVASNQLPTLRR